MFNFYWLPKLLNISPSCRSLGNSGYVPIDSFKIDTEAGSNVQEINRLVLVLMIVQAMELVQKP